MIKHDTKFSCLNCLKMAYLFICWKSIYLICTRNQRLLLNGQIFSWENVNTNIPQSVILVLLLFLFYINCLDRDLSSEPNLFEKLAINISSNELTSDFSMKIESEPWPKQTVSSSHFWSKNEKRIDPHLVFNIATVSQ